MNDLKKEIKNKNYDNNINQKQSQIIEQVNQPIQNDEQYFKAVNDLIKPLDLSLEAKDEESIESIIKLIETPKDETAILQVSYENVLAKVQTFKSSIEQIRSSYENFYSKYQLLIKDVEKFNKVSLEGLLSEGLLSEGLSNLERKTVQDEICPLCLQPKNREDLITELRDRIAELSAFKKEKKEFVESRNTTQSVIQNCIVELILLIGEKCLSLPENVQAKQVFEKLSSLLTDAVEHIKSSSFDKRTEIKVSSELFKIENEKIETVFSEITERKNKILAEKKDNIKFIIHKNLILVKQAYSEIKTFRKELDILRKQQQSLEAIYKEFAAKQKVAFESFLKGISSNINRFYLFMNEGERVDEIELIPLEENDEFVGITFQFKFHGDSVSPPNKYLSESHLNCLGISLFLSSVLAFNKINKFLILDDVISSFDRHHRVRFANLLVEQFADYQIFLFTHEKDWFDYVENMVKGKSWVIKKMNWDYEHGSSLETPLGDLKERIEQKLKSSDSTDLGNMMRRYLEGMLKEVCANLEVKVPFRYNEQNEKRMASELLTDLRGHLKRVKNDIDAKAIFDRLSASTFLGNVTSHDSDFAEDISDLKAFYNDVLSLEIYFFCGDCGKNVSSKYYDTVEKKIRCSCGTLKYLWDK